MALTRSDIRLNDKIMVAPFEAEVIEANSEASCVKVKDDEGNVSYVFINRLAKIAPYKDGAVYLSNGRTFYRYVAGKAPGENGTWREQVPLGNTLADRPGYGPEQYLYPQRPMREVTLGEPVTE